MRELLETYPKATEVVKSYYLEKLLQSLEGRGLPDEFKDHVKQQGISNDMLEKLLVDGPRNLFDVFDENEIYIVTFIDRKDQSPKVVHFKFSVSTTIGIKVGSVELLENRLK